MPVADEVYGLYPEHPDHLRAVADNPAHQFFKRFGEAMPKGDWHDPGTKQGIYMMGPNAEYLEGKFAASSDPADIAARLERALERWKSLKAEKGYAEKAVPTPGGKVACPPEIEGELILRTNVRDLPKDGQPGKGQRFEDSERRGEAWMGFTEWAWNEDWFGVPDASLLVTTGADWKRVDDTLWRSICRQVLVDTVRGQAPRWQEGHVKEAWLEVRILPAEEGSSTLEYRGRAVMDAGAQGFDARVYGQGVYDHAQRKFVKFDLVALGARRGAWTFNQRKDDPGPSPMGVTLSLAPAAEH